MHIGTAGWNVSRNAAENFPTEGSHLQRYAQGLNCVEINSSFYRSHDVKTYQRWASVTPDDFRFSVKLPKAISHDGGLQHVREPLQKFLAEVEGLGHRLAVILVQLPPYFEFDANIVKGFFSLLRENFSGTVACEPRHSTWFTPQVDLDLSNLQITRVAADPAICVHAARPGGWLGNNNDGSGALLYYRWHGSPRTYWSRYEHTWLQERFESMQQWPSIAEKWCIFDNTAVGAAIENALELRQLAQKQSKSINVIESDCCVAEIHSKSTA